MAVQKPLSHLREAEKILEEEIARLREEVRMREEALTNLRLSINVFRRGRDFARGAVVPQVGKIHRTRSRRGLSKRAGHYDHILYRGQVLESAGKFLDHIGVPHYFSDMPGRGGRNDAAQRQILKWGRDDPAEAAKVLLVQENGNQIALWDFMKQQGWA